MSPTESSKRPIVIGVVGGIASGKSNFTNVLQSLGAEKIDADALAHQVLKRPLVVRRLTQLLGPSITNSKGELDRSRLAELAFPLDGSPSEALKHLEEVTHPLIHAEAVKRLSTLRDERVVPAVVIDAPLLIEAGWAPMCDVIVFIDTALTVRMSRAAARGWTEEHFRARERAQLPLADKRRHATHCVSGELATDQLVDFAKKLLQQYDASEVG